MGLISEPFPPEADVADQYFVDISTDFAFGTFICFKPENLNFDDAIGGTLGGGVGHCTWENSFTSRDVEDDLIVSEDYVEAWSHYFRLRYGSFVIMSGPITQVGGNYGDQFVSVGGSTWEVYFTRWEYPFDPRPDHVNDFQFPNTFIGNEITASGDPTPTGLVYQANNRDLELIVGDIFINVMTTVPYRFQFGIDTGTLGIRTNFQYTLGDDSTIDSFMSNMASIGDGFDYWIGREDLTLHFGTPFRFGNPTSPYTVYTVLHDMPGMLDGYPQYVDTGIAGNHVLGLGAGLAVQTQLGSAYGWVTSQNTYSRLDTSQNYGDVRNQDELNAMTRKLLSLSVNPVHAIQVAVDPSIFTQETSIPFWPTFLKGRAVQIICDMLFHKINSPQQIMSYTCAVTDEGVATVTWTFREIYAEPSDFGNPEA